jgi:hypothetical protein
MISIGVAYPLCGHSEEPRTILFFKDGKTTRIPAPPEVEDWPPSVESLFASKEDYIKAQEAHDEMMKEQGLPPSPVHVFVKKEKYDPNDKLYFELPPDEALGGCEYNKGYSFPSACYDENNERIFEAGKDPQSVLDDIKLNEGYTGEYNVVSEDYAEYLKEDREVKGDATDDQSAMDDTTETKGSKASKE